MWTENELIFLSVPAYAQYINHPLLRLLIPRRWGFISSDSLPLCYTGLSFLCAGDDQMLPEHWWWAALEAREQRGFVNRKGWECAQDTGNASTSQPTDKWRREWETASPDHKKGKDKSSFSAFSSVPLCFNHHSWFTLKRRAGLMAPECKIFL